MEKFTKIPSWVRKLRLRSPISNMARMACTVAKVVLSEQQYNAFNWWDGKNGFCVWGYALRFRLFVELGEELATLLGSGIYLLNFLQFFTFRISFFFNIIVILKTQPKLSCGSKILLEP